MKKNISIVKLYVLFLPLWLFAHSSSRSYECKFFKLCANARKMRRVEKNILNYRVTAAVAATLTSLASSLDNDLHEC